MRRWLTCCLLVLTTVAAAAESTALDRLQAEAQRATTALHQQRATIEADRKRHLAEHQERAETLRAQRAELVSLRQQLKALEKNNNPSEQSALPVAVVVRRLAGEIPHVVDPRMEPGALIAEWPAVVAAVNQRLDGLHQAVTPRLEDSAVLDRAGQPVTLPVWWWGAVQGVALGDGHQQRGVLQATDDGGWLITGPSIDNTFNNKPLAMGSITTLATKQQSVVQRGGWFVWPILLAGSWGLWILIDRLRVMRSWRHPATAPLAMVVAAARSSGDEAQRRAAAGAALSRIDVDLQRGLRVLAVLAASAPLLGLLGTVSGMITSFRGLDFSGGGRSELLTSGIGEALITTELGLVVAIPLLVAHAVFARQAQRYRARCEAEALVALGQPAESDHA